MRLHPTGMFDNHAAPARHIQVLPLAAAMGAEIAGVDLAGLTDAQFAEIQAALFRHKMIFFRGQRLTHDQHAAFSLRSVQIPPFGGDTIWANSALAYAALSDAYRAMIAPLKVHFSMRQVLRHAQESVEMRDSPIGRLGATRGADALPDDVARKVRGSVHPLVRTHPVTGETALYIDEAYAVGLDGMTEDEAQPILRYLLAHLIQPAFTCRLRWEPDMLAIWDNRLSVHQAFNDYQGYRRELYRCTVSGETPA